MPETEKIIGYLEAALRGTATRQTLVASNIANLETPGYRRLDTMFQKVLADAIEDGKLADLDENEAWVFTPRTTAVNAHGNDVDLDVEVGEMIKNAALYKTYVRLLARMYRQMDLAIRDDLR